MPLINGQKMACEPCIRGHRSTKCTHANERLMVPVRKPGRPLSSCPHPASRPCSCAQVTAAIPRKQKCHCGTGSTETSKIKSEKSESSNSSKDATPQSPSKATNSSYRVQKTTNKNVPSNPGRRQSVDPAAFERMDPNMVNVMPSYNNGVQQNSPVIPDMSAAYGAMGMVPAESPFGPMVYPMFPPQMPPPMMNPDLTNGMSNGHTVALANGPAQEKVQSPAQKVGSCCGGGGGGGGGSGDDETSNGVTTGPPTAQSSTRSSPANSSPVTAKEPEAKSCCSSVANASNGNPKSDVLPSPDVATQNGIPMMPPFQAPMIMPNGMYGYYPHPTIFTYPPQYGSYLQPLQPEQWRQMMASMTFAPPGAMPAPYPMPGHMAFQPQGVHHHPSGTSHQCSCGASCQCVGCAAHPYNEATQNYVRSAWQSMMDDSQNHAGHTNGNSNHVHPNGSGINETPTQTDSPTTNSTPVISSIEGTRSPTAPQTPSDAPSGMSEEQALSASDFFFVSYPFGDSCAGDTASCPCGDDCQCIGCVIHNNPDPATEAGNEA